MRSLESAAALVTANTAIKSKKGNRKSLFHELLLNAEIDRDTVINQIAITLEAEGDPLSDEKFMELRTSVAKSVANFCSHSYRETTAKATYNHDPEFADYELKRNGNLLSITLREK